jgi:hypothetical protein
MMIEGLGAVSLSLTCFASRNGPLPVGERRRKPTVRLSPTGRGELAKQAGESIVFVTHSIPEAVFLSTKIVVMSPRPGKIHEIIDCDLGAERPLEIRETPEFLAIAQRVRDGLRAGHSYDD